MTTAMSGHILRDVVCLAIQANAWRILEQNCLIPKGETTESEASSYRIFFAVGWLEVVSVLFRPDCASFRLFRATSMLAKAVSSDVPDIIRCCRRSAYSVLFPRIARGIVQRSFSGC